MNAIQIVCLIAALAIYVLADGFALGVSLLLLLAPRQQDRDAMVETFASVLRSNEIWLGIAGLVLALAFPFVLSVLPKYYLPIAIMAFALLARGVAFRFRLQSGRLQRAWEFAFAGGAALAILCQGFVLAGLANALAPVIGWAIIFALICAAMLLGGYVLLGAGWLIWRATAPVQTFGREVSHAALILVGGGTVAAFAWMLLVEPDAVALPDASTPLLLLVGAIVGVLIWRNLWSRRTHLVFTLGLALFVVGLAGLADTLWALVAGGSTVMPGGFVQYAIGLCVGAALVITLPVTISQMFRRELEHNDAGLEPHLVPCAGCRRAQSLPTELHFS